MFSSHLCTLVYIVATYVSLASVIMCELVGLEKLTNGFGLLCMVRGITAIAGPPFEGMWHPLPLLSLRLFTIIIVYMYMMTLLSFSPEQTKPSLLLHTCVHDNMISPHDITNIQFFFNLLVPWLVRCVGKCIVKKWEITSFCDLANRKTFHVELIWTEIEKRFILLFICV